MKIVQIGANRGNDHVTELVKRQDYLDCILLVEPNKLVITELQECYSSYENVIIEQCAIVTDNQISEVNLYYSPNMMPRDAKPTYELGSLSKEYVINNCEETEETVKVDTVSAMTLEKLLDKHKLNNIDYLFVDIEGLDADVILSLNLRSKFDIKSIQFEQIHMTADVKEKVDNFLKYNGYSLTNSFHEYDDRYTK